MVRVGHTIEKMFIQFGAVFMFEDRLDRRVGKGFDKLESEAGDFKKNLEGYMMS